MCLANCNFPSRGACHASLHALTPGTVHFLLLPPGDNMAGLVFHGVLEIVISEVRIPMTTTRSRCSTSRGLNVGVVGLMVTMSVLLQIGTTRFARHCVTAG